MHFRASIGGRKRYVQGASAEPRGVGWQLGAGHHSMGRGATFFRLRTVVYCPSLGARLNAVFMHGLSQIACMLRPPIASDRARHLSLLRAPSGWRVAQALADTVVSVGPAPRGASPFCAAALYEDTEVDPHTSQHRCKPTATERELYSRASRGAAQSGRRRGKRRACHADGQVLWRGLARDILAPPPGGRRRHRQAHPRRCDRGS